MAHETMRIFFPLKIITYPQGEYGLDENLPDELRELFGQLGIHPDTVREVMRKEGYFV